MMMIVKEAWPNFQSTLEVESAFGRGKTENLFYILRPANFTVFILPKMTESSLMMYNEKKKVIDYEVVKNTASDIYDDNNWTADTVIKFLIIKGDTVMTASGVSYAISPGEEKEKYHSKTVLAL